MVVVYFWYNLLKVMEDINKLLAHYAIFLEWWAVSTNLQLENSMLLVSLCVQFMCLV